MPSFVSRVERPDRGGEWVGYLRAARARRPSAGRAARARPRGDADDAAAVGAAAARRRRRGPTARRAAVRGRRAARGAAARRASSALGGDERAQLLARPRRRARATAATGPGRGFEALRYRFEIVSDYGAFRDLQRHRMLTVQWQALTPDLGAGVPEEVDAAGGGDAYARALERSRAEYERLVAAGLRRGGAVRALPRLPHPLRAGPQRARGDAPDRAALRPRGPPELPRGRARDARAIAERPPGRRRGDEHVDHERRAAPGAAC